MQQNPSSPKDTSANVTEQMVAKLNFDDETFQQKMIELAGNSRLSLGANALVFIRQAAGEEGVKDFASWAVHPKSGFLPQTQRAKPMEPKIKEVLQKFVDFCNDNVDNVNIAQSMQIANLGPIHLTSVPGKKAHLFHEKANATASDAPDEKHMFVQIGKKRELQEQHYTSAVLGMKGAIAMNALSIDHYVTFDEVARAASKTLEKLLIPNPAKDFAR